jgi:thioredoxin-related protein
MKYRVVLGSPELKERFHVNSLPTTVVFDRSGKALQRFEGFTKADLLESAVKTAL